MSLIKIEDIAHVRFSAPDLQEMERFLSDFGLSSQLGQDGRLYACAQDGSPYCHVTEMGEAGFRALGLRAESVEDLNRLATNEKSTVKDNPIPGGGKILHLVDPDGFTVEVVAGQERSSKSALPAEPIRNNIVVQPRQSEAVRLEPGPSHVMRLGHAVLNVSDFRRSEKWYKERFGFITSDEIEAAPDVSIGAFMRCDRGDQPTDHHTLFLAQLPQKPGFLHAAFEVANMDDLMLGHDYLKEKKWESAWGVGRHILGSQIFDYWRDPWGHELEHWTDGDLFTAKDGSNRAPATDLLAVQWGMQNPILSGKMAPSAKTMSFALAQITRLKNLFRSKS